MRIFSLIMVAFLSAFSSLVFAESREITHLTTLPDGLKDCKLYVVVVEGKILDVPLYVVRCSGNDSVSTSTTGKNRVHTNLIEGSGSDSGVEVLH